MRPGQVLRVVRKATLALTVLGAAYLLWRFDLEALPEDRCSPLTRFSGGDQLLIDRRPTDLAPGNALLVRDGTGLLHLGLVERVRPEDGPLEAVWVVTDARDCPAPDSEDFGWIPARDVTGRVVLVWPW